ncbi:MAG: MoaD/ThiS family protein [Chloroflexota bacterium]
MQPGAESVRVELKLLAAYRRYLPCETAGNSCIVEVPSGTPVIDLLASFDVPGKHDASVVLINGRDAAVDRVLEDGDVVTVFPAMAGG